MHYGLSGRWNSAEPQIEWLQYQDDLVSDEPYYIIVAIVFDISKLPPGVAWMCIRIIVICFALPTNLLGWEDLEAVLITSSFPESTGSRCWPKVSRVVDDRITQSPEAHSSDVMVQVQVSFTPTN